MWDDAQMRREALAAYERGRLRWALRAAFIIVPLVLLSLRWTVDPLFNLACGLSLLVVVTTLRSRGGDFAKAANLGLSAGAFAYLFPLSIQVSSHACGATCGMDLAPCIAGGVIAGLVIGRQGAAIGLRQPRYALVAAGVAGLVGALTCAPLGMAITVGMAFAAAFTASTVLVAVRA